MKENVKKLARLVALMDHQSIITRRMKKYNPEGQRLFAETLVGIDKEIKGLKQELAL